MTTTNLTDFGTRELDLLKDLITAMNNQGLPKNFYNDEVHPMLNQMSGNVFLTNSEYQVAMMNGDKLEMFYTLGYHGNEGFANDLYFDYQNNNIGTEDYEELADILEAEGLDTKAEEIRTAID